MIYLCNKSTIEVERTKEDAAVIAKEIRRDWIKKRLLS
jgi:hypothetical protein